MYTYIKLKSIVHMNGCKKKKTYLNFQLKSIEN